MPRPRRSTGKDGAGFLLPFGRRPSLLGHPVPPAGFRPSYDRPTAPANGADPSGVSMFRTRETRLGPGALFTPGTAVPSRSVNPPDRRTPPSSGRSLFTPVQHSAPGCNCDEASSRVHWRSPLPAFPSPVIPGTVRGPSGFSLSSAPSRARPSHARQGGNEPQALPGVTSSASLTSFDVLTQRVRPHVARLTRSARLQRAGPKGLIQYRSKASFAHSTLARPSH
jgi:hypothetical protein